ncbi:hypothetical protein B9Z65_5047 [Elsinoe australis]|uniref:Glycosyl hydrolases family 43 protein n=1 Tax=Elsinoe australis TaxID=40998 RepID=A0A2P7ZD12_9PEZI|nr:hypothetical protein B9Z65_5047 [Elsinoe australis]
MQSNLHNGLHRSSLPPQLQSISTSHQTAPDTTLQSPQSPIEFRKRSVAGPSSPSKLTPHMNSDEEKKETQVNVQEVSAPPPPPPYPGTELSLYQRFFCKPQLSDPEKRHDPTNRTFSLLSRGAIFCIVMFLLALAIVIGPVLGLTHRNGTNGTTHGHTFDNGDNLIPNGPVGSTDSAFALGRNSTVSLGLYTNFADPFIVQHDGLWYAYATNNAVGVFARDGVNATDYHFDLSNVQMAVSSDFRNWNLTAHTNEPLPQVGAWAPQTRRQLWPQIAKAAVWAPAVVQRPVDKKWVMYYAAQTNERDFTHCIGAAVSDGDSPAGPYTPVADDFVCNVNMGGSIDAAPFVDTNADGTTSMWVAYKIDGNNRGHGGQCGNTVNPMKSTPIMLQRVADDGYTPLERPWQILDRSSADRDGPLVEAPSIVKSPEGIYFLFFSSGCTANANYNVKYAWSNNITGPYTRGDRPLLYTGMYNLLAPGSCTVAKGDDGVFRMAFHARVFSMFGGIRMLFTSAVKFNGTKAILYNPDTFPNSTINTGAWNKTDTSREFVFAPGSKSGVVKYPAKQDGDGDAGLGGGVAPDGGDADPDTATTTTTTSLFGRATTAVITTTRTTGIFGRATTTVTTITFKNRGPTTVKTVPKPTATTNAQATPSVKGGKVHNPPKKSSKKASKTTTKKVKATKTKTTKKAKATKKGTKKPKTKKPTTHRKLVGNIDGRDS